MSRQIKICWRIPRLLQKTLKQYRQINGKYIDIWPDINPNIIYGFNFEVNYVRNNN